MGPDAKFDELVRALTLEGQVLAYAVAGAFHMSGHEHAIQLGNRGWKLGISRDEQARVMEIINSCFLFPRELEWTSHGVKRSFRFWSSEEKAAYLAYAEAVVATLAGELSSNVCVGYGTALAIARSQDLIPHDDDVDIIIALPRALFPTIARGITAVEGCLTRAGFECVGDYVSHRHIRNPSGRSLDIFVGIDEGGYFSSFPGPRRTILMSDVFPSINKEICGEICRVPRNLSRYLSLIYGASWETPDPTFSHRWDRTPFDDLLS